MTPLTRNLTPGVTGVDVAEMQSELVKLGHPLPVVEIQAQQVGPATLAAMQQIQAAQGLPPTPEVIEPAASQALNEVVQASTYTISGHVTSTTSLGLGGLKVQLVDKN